MMFTDFSELRVAEPGTHGRLHDSLPEWFVPGRLEDSRGLVEVEEAELTRR